MSDHDFVDDVDPPGNLVRCSVRFDNMQKNCRAHKNVLRQKFPDYLVGLLRQHLKSPYERFELPVTTAQEIGFYATSDAVSPSALTNGLGSGGSQNHALT